MKDGRYIATGDNSCWTECTLKTTKRGRSVQAIDAKDGHPVWWGASPDWLEWAEAQIAKGKLVPADG